MARAMSRHSARRTCSPPAVLHSDAELCGIPYTTPSSSHFGVVSQVGAFLSTAAGCVSVGPAANPDPPVVEISAPQVVGCCDALVLEGIASYPSTGNVSAAFGCSFLFSCKALLSFRRTASASLHSRRQRIRSPSPSSLWGSSAPTTLYLLRRMLVVARGVFVSL